MTSTFTQVLKSNTSYNDVISQY